MGDKGSYYGNHYQHQQQQQHYNNQQSQYSPYGGYPHPQFMVQNQVGVAQYQQQNPYQVYAPDVIDDFNQDDYDNEEEIERELNRNGNSSYDAALQEFEQDIAMAGSYSNANRKTGGAYIPEGAMPQQNGVLSKHAAEFWFPECRNCPCCKGFKHGCPCRSATVDTCKDPMCVDGVFQSQVNNELTSRTQQTKIESTDRNHKNVQDVQDSLDDQDLDNLDAIEEELSKIQLQPSTSYDEDLAKFEEQTIRKDFSMSAESIGTNTSSRAYIPAGAMPQQNGVLSKHAAEFWFPECRNCPCCKGFKHGCQCRTASNENCKDPQCVDIAYQSSVNNQLESRITNNAPPAPATRGSSTLQISPPTPPISHTNSNTAPVNSPGIICKFESSPTGCMYGSKCRFKHMKPANDSIVKKSSSATACVYFQQGTCQYGDSCRYSHAR
eukprot:gene10158-13665_t